VLCPHQSSIKMDVQVFHSVFGGRATLPICTVGQAWLRIVNVICMDLISFLLILYRPSDSRMSANLVPTFADRGCHVVSATDPYGRYFCFLDRSPYFSIQVAPQLSSRG
jgi:hypothetical protein